MTSHIKQSIELCQCLPQSMLGWQLLQFTNRHQHLYTVVTLQPFINRDFKIA